MRTADGVIKVLDFGIASVAQPANHDPNNSPTLALAAGAIGWSLRPILKPPETPLRIFTLPTPGTTIVGAETMLESNTAISPDGRYIAFVKGNQLWLRDLSVEQPRIVDGVSRPSSLFWSPDSKRIGFLQGRDLKTAPVDGGTPRLVTTFDGRVRIAAWSLDGGTILICEPVTPIQAWTPPAGKYLTSISFMPSPKGDRVLVGGFGNSATQDIIIVNLETGKARNLGRGNFPVYAGNHSILFQTENALSALRMLTFHPDTWEQIGDSTAVLTSTWRPTVSAEETLVWMDPPFDAGQNRQLAWRDRTGRRLAAVGGPEQYLQSLELSPDGGRAAFSATLTNDVEYDGAPLWSPDGKEIAFRSSRTGIGDIYVQAADGSTPARLAVAGPEVDYPRAWSPDGSTILFVRQADGSGQDLWATTRRTDGSFGKPTPFLQSNNDQNQPGFSPDGRYVVYTSSEGGRAEIYVRPYPSGGERIQISTNGGSYPRWSANGKEIFFLKGDAMMAVPVSLQPVFQAKQQVELFQVPGLTGVYAPFDVTPDGQRFLISEAVESSEPKAISLHVIQNWRGLLKQ